MELQGKGLGVVDLLVLANCPAVVPEQQHMVITADVSVAVLYPPLPPRSLRHLTAGACR